jgi:phage gp36-like protein
MYLSIDELILSFSKQVIVQLSNDDPRASEPNEQVLQQAIQTACERIDGSLRGRYRLPLEDQPTMLKSYALSLARYWLYARRPEKPLPEAVKDDYKTAVEDLQEIARGKLHLGFAEIEQSKESYGDIVDGFGEHLVSAPNRIDLSGY